MNTRELNRALLARQLLLERAPAGTPIPRTLERMGGLQAQYAPSMYVGLWSRLDGMVRSDLTAALENRSVVQGTLLRATIHLVSAEDYWPFALAVREPRRRWWLRATRNEFDSAHMKEAAAALNKALAGGPMRRAEVEAVVGKGTAMNGIGLWIDLVRVPPSGTWERRRADLFEAAESWLGASPSDLDESSALEHMVRRYLGAFGPATAREIGSWLGAPKEAQAAVERLPLEHLTHDETGDMLVDVDREADGAGADRPGGETPAPVRFLPWWDATLLVHARRKQILREDHRPMIFHTKNPQSVGTFLVDGTVAGTWRYDGPRVHYDPFENLPRRVERQVAAEAERLSEFSQP